MGQQHLKFSFNKLAELLADYEASNMDVAAKIPQILKRECLTHTLSHTRQQRQLSFSSSSMKVFNNGLKSVFANCYDVAVRLTFGT